MHSIPAATLRADAAALAFGVIFLAVGLLAVGIRLLRKGGDLSLLYFGIASALYGLRLLVLSDSIGIAYSAVILNRIAWTITFLIGIPFVLYFSSTVQLGWKKVVWATIAIQASLALFGIPATYTGVGFALAQKLNNVLVVVFMPVLFLLIILGPKIVDRNVIILRLGALALGIFSVYTNLVAMKIIPGSDRLEPIGFVIFLGCLGYVSANRSIRNEENLIAIRSELEVARNIQAGLLPAHDFAVPDLKISAKYVPLSSVAGDFYDFLVVDHCTGVLIADVTGHGVPAALTASMVKIGIRAQAPHAADPSQVLAGLNSVLHGNLQGQFVTAAYVYFDPKSHKLAYSGAGHPPLLIWRAAQRKVETLESNGLFLGPFPTVQYPTLETTFEPGDRCLLYTDGVLEATTPTDEEFGQAQLSKFLTDNSSTPGPAFCDSLLHRLREWSQHSPTDEQNDDITIVAVDYRKN